VFVAILSDKLAPEHRQRARLIGLSLALVMRLGLLAGISWVMSLSELVKATTEIHERVEGGTQRPSGGAGHAAFWPVVAQIVALISCSRE
jgi:predicted tellurium resistance membrane protein TerC